MSEIKVNKISPRTNCGTVQLGDSGDTITIPAGATITNNGTQTGFGRTGTVNWQTTVKTAGFTAANGEGYFVNTTSGGITVNLPAGSAGDIVAFKDYANTWDSNAVTVVPNGTDKIGGSNANATLNTESQSVTLIFIDSTKGWLDIHDSTSNIIGQTFMTATGGNATVTVGDFKTHIFTGPGTFTVCSVSTSPANNKVDYLVVGGGGGGYGGGGGAGGFRLFSTAPGTNSPLNNSGASPNTEVTVTATSFPIAVGGGGAGTPGTPPVYNSPTAADGVASSFSTVTSAGGGKAGAYRPSSNPTDGYGANGGSGGGGAYFQSGSAVAPGGSGNTPPVSPSQGNGGGSGQHVPGIWAQAGGGGGAGASGTNGTPGAHGVGGIGSYVADPFIGPTAPSYGTPGGPVSNVRYFSGGGTGPGPAPAGGGGQANSNGGVNTGGGAGSGTPSGSGGSGIVMIRYKFQ